MQALKDRIRQEGTVHPGSIVKVDSFLNHQVDARFLGLIWTNIRKYQCQQLRVLRGERVSKLARVRIIQEVEWVSVNH